MFNKVFLTDLAERGLSTALQAWAAAFAVPGPDVLDSIKIGLVAGLVSVWFGAQAYTNTKNGK